MLKKSLALVILIFYSSLIYAAPKALDLELGKSTAQDVKRMYKIKEKDYWHDLTVYKLELSGLPDDKLKSVTISCDADEVIQKIELLYDREEFDNIISSLSSNYELYDCIPPVDRSFEVELIAEFRDGDARIIVDAPRNRYELCIQYYSPKFMNRNYKEK